MTGHRTLVPADDASSASASRIDVFGLGSAFTLIYHLVFRQYFPNELGKLGHDYSYFLPHILAGDFWIQRNGLFAIPWFTPAFCGGVPMYANPQSPFFTVPQLFSAILFDPLTSVYLTVLLFAWLGYLGFYLLVRGPFGATRPAAILGAVLFMWNGFYVHRMMIGHLTFHGFMLTPLLAFLLLRIPAEGQGTRRMVWMWDVAMAGVLLAYMVMSGMIHTIVPVGLAVGVIGIICGMIHGGRHRFWLGFGAAVSVAGALCVSRLFATSAFLSGFPRNDYKLPGADSVLGATRLLLESLFFRPAYQAADTILVNVQVLLEQHEFEFSITFVPAVALVAGSAVVLWRRRKGIGRPAFRLTAAIEALVVALILLLPMALNTYSPAWNQLLKQVPLIGSSATLIRWFCIYIPVVILGAALVFDAAARFVTPTRKWMISGAGVLACLTANLLADDSYYQRQPYDPVPITQAYERIDSGVPDIQGISNPGNLGNDNLVQGMSPGLCYEPIFGYTLEHLPFKSLRPGPALAERDGLLNLKNPACYVFPEENGCTPGDHFTSQQRPDAEAFVRYQPFPFEIPARQSLANVVTLLSLIGVTVLLAAGFFRRKQEPSSTNGRPQA